MSPGGHLVTSGLLSGALYALTGSAALAAGVGVGGFLIDVDHAVDYVVLESHRDLRPAAFLRHYVEERHRRVVLALHSYELLAVLVALAWLTNAEALWGYVLGMSLHLPLDIVFNGQRLSRNLVPFYSFVHRWRAGFGSQALLGVTGPRPERGGFWRGFFAEFFPAHRDAVIAAAVRRVPAGNLADA